MATITAEVEAPRLSQLLPGFLRYAQAELQFSEQSLIKYRDCLRQIQKRLGDLPVSHYTKEHVLQLKADMLRRGLSASRQISLLSAFKRLLAYCLDEGMAILDPGLITVPKRAPARGGVSDPGRDRALCRRHSA